MFASVFIDTTRSRDAPSKYTIQYLIDDPTLIITYTLYISVASPLNFTESKSYKFVLDFRHKSPLTESYIKTDQLSTYSISLILQRVKYVDI